MSKLSHFIGKIPLVGHAINEVGKVLPSGGQMLGSAMLGPVGTALGGAIDGNTTPLQKNIGNTIAAGEGLAGGITGLGAALGGGAAGAAGGTAAGGAGAASGLEGAIAGLPGGAELLSALKAGAAGLGDVLDFLKGHSGDLLGAANVAEAALREQKADKYANQAFNTASDAYNAKAPLRMAGISGMLKPTTPDTSALRSLAGPLSGNPFARSLPMAQAPMAGGAPSVPSAPGSPALPAMPLTGVPPTNRPVPVPMIGLRPMPVTPPRLAMPV